MRRVCWKYSKRNIVGHVFITVNIHNDTLLSEVLTRNSINRTFVNWVREPSLSLRTTSVPLGVLPARKIMHGYSETRVWQEDAYHMPHIPCLINKALRRYELHALVLSQKFGLRLIWAYVSAHNHPMVGMGFHMVTVSFVIICRAVNFVSSKYAISHLNWVVSCLQNFSKYSFWSMLFGSS